MWETVKEVNGYRIFRMVGTRGCYHIRLDEHREVTFKTIKAGNISQDEPASPYKSPGTFSQKM